MVEGTPAPAGAVKSAPPGGPQLRKSSGPQTRKFCTADFIIEKRKKTEIAIAKIVDDPVGYLAKLPGSILSDVCSAPVQYYGKIMGEQARGRWRNLPSELIDAVQDDYSVDLRSVQYVEGVTTSNGQAQTIGKRIYFPTSIDLTTESDMHWILHELEHAVQVSNATYSTAGKLCEYVAKAIGSGGPSRCDRHGTRGRCQAELSDRRGTRSD